MSDDDLYVDGEVEGSIEAIRSKVTLGPNARVTASISARHLIVFGRSHGPVSALEVVNLKKGCELFGDVTTARILIEDGAFFRGSIDIRRTINEQSDSEANVLEERYSKLVDLKYLRGLTPSERDELESLAARLALLDADFYEPILDHSSHASGSTGRVAATLGVL